MAQSDLFKRYLDAGIAFTEMTRERAQAIVREWVNAGDVPMQRADDFIEDIVERSRQNTAAIVSLVQAQVQDQLSALGLATKADIARLEAKINRASGPGGGGAGAAAKRTAAKKSAAKKSAAKKSAAKKSAAKKSAAKKSAAS